MKAKNKLEFYCNNSKKHQRSNKKLKKLKNNNKKLKKLKKNIKKKFQQMRIKN